MANNTIGLQAVIDVTQFNQGLQLYVQGMLKMTQATQTAATQINSLGSATSAGLGAALGTAAINIIGTFINALGSLGSAIADNSTNFERLGVSLNFFTARAAQQVDESLSLASALAQTTVQAQGLMLWVERLATLSPFTTEQVGNALRTAQAYGLTLGAAQKIVPLLTDFAAVTGLSAEAMQRVVLAISQVQARGKLASQEINQLANAGVPIRDILVKGLNVSRGELEKMLEDGLIPASKAIQVITDYLQGFEGAAESITRNTLGGLISSLKDIVSISSRDLFGPAFASLFPILNQLIDIGNSNQFKAGIKVIGDALGEELGVKVRLATSYIIELVNAITSLPDSTKQAIAIFTGFTAVLIAFYGAVGLVSVAVGLLVNPFTLVTATIAAFITAYATNFAGLKDITTNVVNVISSTFQSITRIVSSTVSTISSVVSGVTSELGGLADSVASYGEAVVQVFATGITGALSFLASAMQTIGGVLAFWLQPGSPPRVAPNLDTWGTESANVWLQGWTKANFDILSGIGSDIGNVLSALVSAGKLDELSAPRILRALRTELASAIDEFVQFGKVSDKTMSDVAKAAGPAANQVTQLFKNYVALVAQTDAVKKAQENLNSITQKYNEILKPLKQQLSDISELRNQADENNEILSLQRLIANVGVSASRKQAAQLRIQEILLQRQVRGLEGKQTAEQDVAQAQIDAAQKARDVAQEDLDRTKAQIDVQNQQLNLYGQELDILEKIRKEQERAAKEARQKMLEQLQKQLKIAQLLQAELKDTVTVFKDQYVLADATSTEVDKQNAKLSLQEVLGNRIVRDFQAMELGIDPSQIEQIRNTLVTLKDIGIKGNPFDDFSDSIGQTQVDTTKLVKDMNDAMQDIRKMFKQTSQDVDDFLNKINDMLPSFLKFRSAVKGDSKSLSDHVRDIDATSAAFNAWPPLLKNLSVALGGIGAGFVTSRILTILPTFLEGLTGPVGIAVAAVSFLTSAWIGDWFNIREVTGDAIKYIQDKIGFLAHSKGWNDFSTNAVDAFYTVEGAITGFGDTIKNTFQNVIQPILQNGISLDTIQQGIARAHTAITTLFSTLKSGLSNDAKTTAKTVGDKLKGFITAYWNPFLAALVINFRQTFTLVSTIFTELGKNFSFLPSLVKGTFGTVLEAVKLGLRGIGGLIVAALKPINSLILSALGGLGHTLASLIFAPIKLLGKGVDLDAVLSPIVNSFSNGFAKRVVTAAPKVWDGLIVSLGKLDGILTQTFFSLVSGAFSTVKAIVKAPFKAADFIDKASFETFKFLVETGFDLQHIFTAVLDTFRTIGGLTFAGFEQFAKAAEFLFALPKDGLTPFADFIQYATPKATATFPLLADAIDLISNGLKILKGQFVDVGVALIDKFLPGFKTLTAKDFLNVITTIGEVLKTSFLSVFGKFQELTPVVTTLFKGLGSGLRDVATLGSIKVLEFFKGLSEGILRFAGSGEAKLGDALAGIFQGAFKGITAGILGAPQLLGDFFGNIKAAAAGKALEVPKIFEGLFKLLGSFKFENIAKGFLTVFESIKNIGGAVGALFDPLTIVLSLIDFFHFSFTHNIDGVENRAQSFVKGLMQAWQDLISGKLWNDIVDNATKAWDTIVKVWEDVQKNGLSSPVLRETLLGLGQTLLNWAQTTGGDLLTSIREFWLPIFGQWIVESISNLGTQLGQVLIFLRDFIVQAAVFLGGLIAQTWTFFWTWWTTAGGEEQTLNWLTMVGSIIGGWITTTASFLYDNFVANWLPAFIQWLPIVIPQILQGLLSLLGAIAGFIIDHIPDIVNALLDWGAAFFNFLGPALGFMIENLGKFLGAMIEWIIGTGVPMLVGGVAYLVQAIVGWISGDSSDTATSQANPHLQAFMKALTDFFVNDIGPALLVAGTAIVTGLWKGFSEAWSKLMETGPAKAVSDFVTGIVNNTINVYNEGIALAKSIIDGIVQGFTTYVTEPYDAFKNWLLNLVGAGQQAIDAHSPSQLAIDLLGKPIADGVIAGIQSITDNPIFKSVKNFAVGGLNQLNKDGTGVVDDFTSGITGLFDGAFSTVQTATNTFTGIMTTTFNTFLQGLTTQFTIFKGTWDEIWLALQTDATTQVQALDTNVMTIINSLALKLGTAMLTIKNTIVGAFTLANTDAATEAAKMAENVLKVLVGTGVDDPTSVAGQVAIAMKAAGELIGDAFIAGMAFVFTDDNSLNPLWIAVDSMVDALVARMQAKMQIGSPSKLAAEEIGKPVAEGIGVGFAQHLSKLQGRMSNQLASTMGRNGMFSQFDSRPATFMPSNVTNVSRNQEMNLYVTTSATSQGVIQDFGVMRTMLRNS